ncbi:MAG: glycosyltransferase family 39 protein, partial [Flavitalea sp.]
MDVIKQKMKASTLWNIVFGITMLVYGSGLFITIMEPDAAVYAEVSMEMHDTGNYLSITHKGVDWLDKPHFPFWMSAISYSIFGVNTFAYKFPAIIFILIAAVYTYLFGKKFYSALHGWLAVLILITAQHIIISNQDVRAEPFMTGLVIMGLYHIAVFLCYRDTGKYKWRHAIAASLALACLMMTKGLFTIIPVSAGIGLTLMYKRNWKQIFHWQWLVVGVFIVLFLSPALYGYYQQFDLHPEKE